MSLIHFSTANNYQNRYLNDADSNTVTNSNAETVLDQFFTLPSENSLPMTEGVTVRITALGTISTGLLSLGFRFRLRVGGLGGVLLCDTGGITILSSLTNSGWLAQSIVSIKSTGTTGTVQAQNYATMQSGALLAMPTTSAVTIDTTVANDITYTAQWTTALPANQFTMRSLYIEHMIPVG